MPNSFPKWLYHFIIPPVMYESSSCQKEFFKNAYLSYYFPTINSFLDFSTQVRNPQDIGKALHFLCPNCPASSLAVSPHAPFFPVIPISIPSTHEVLSQFCISPSLYHNAIFFLICIPNAYSYFQRCLLITSHLHPHPCELIDAIPCSPDVQGLTPL